MAHEVKIDTFLRVLLNTMSKVGLDCLGTLAKSLLRKLRVINGKVKKTL